MGENHFVYRLVEYAGNAQHENGPRVFEHTAQQGAVEPPFHRGEFGQKQKGDRGRAGQVDGKGIKHVGAVQHDEEEHIQRDVYHDEEQFECGKLNGSPLVAQIGERHTLEGVNGHTHCHHADEFGMFGIAHGRRDGAYQGQHRHGKEQGHAAHGYECVGIDLFGVFALFVHKTEKGGLHAEGEQHKQQGHIAVHLGDDTVAARGGGQFGRVEWHEQIVQKAAHDAAQTIDGRIFGQRTQFSHITKVLLMQSDF